MASRIFISYRREDSDIWVGRLADELRRHFPPEQIFQDVASIDPGAPFREVLDQALATAAAMLVVIGPQWLSATDKQGRKRLEQPADLVRQEVAESLRRPGVRVFPLLVGGAEMPAEEDLPGPLQSLAERHAFELTVRHWTHDVAQLVQTLKRNAAEEESRPGAVTGPVREPPPTVPWKPLAVIGAVIGIGLLVFFALRDRPESRSVSAPPVVSTPAPPVEAPKVQPPPPSPSAPTAAAPKAKPPTVLSSPKAAPTFKPGESFREPDCAKCPMMVVVPAGEFTMGSPEGEAGRNSDEGPQHRVTIARPLAVGKYEVTFDEWDACVAAGGCAHKPGDRDWGRVRRPVINVSWNDTQAYIAWLSNTTGKPYRLLSEAEWEYAARGGTATRYPWGDAPGTNRANFKDSGREWSGKQTAPVGSFGANKFGLHDMIGNVWEWVQDCWNGSYQGAPGDGRAWESGDCGRCVVRGGSWFSGPENARAANRSRIEPGGRNSGLGFRVARTL